jgi:hypothetical protein
MSISNYYEELLLNCLGNAAATDPRKGTVYVSLHTADPGETGASEVTGGDYARKAITWAAASNPAGTKANSADIQWATVTWAATVTHAALWDALTVGNCLWSGALAASKTVASGDTFTIATGSLVVTLG